MCRERVILFFGGCGCGCNVVVCFGEVDVGFGEVICNFGFFEGYYCFNY